MSGLNHPFDGGFLFNYRSALWNATSFVIITTMKMFGKNLGGQFDGVTTDMDTGPSLRPGWQKLGMDSWLLLNWRVQKAILAGYFDFRSGLVYV
jgi:hypothetical protein